MRPALALCLLLAAPAPAAAQWTSRYEDLGYLAVRVHVLGSICDYDVDEAAWLDWTHGAVPPDARPAFRAGADRARAEIKRAYGQEALAALDPQGSGLSQPTREWTALLNACPDLRAAAEALGLLAAP